MEIFILIALIIGIILATLVCCILCAIVNKCYWKGGVNKYKADLTGQVALVTGGTDGIGKFTVLKLAESGAKVYFTGRSLTKAQEVEKLALKARRGQVIFERVDNSDLKQVKELADKINKQEKSLNILVNNAGLWCANYAKTKHGFERTMGINYFGHVYLTGLLLPKLNSTPESRIVNTASYAHNLVSKQSLKDIDFFFMDGTADTFDANDMYYRSKLGNVLFSKRLDRYLKNQNMVNIKTVSLHPGVVMTSLYEDLKKKYCIISFLFICLTPLFWIIFKNSEEGSQTNFHCCLLKWSELQSGKYYSDCAQKAANANTRNEHDLNRTWEQAKELLKKETGEDLFVEGNLKEAL